MINRKYVPLPVEVGSVEESVDMIMQSLEPEAELNFDGLLVLLIIILALGFASDE